MKATHSKTLVTFAGLALVVPFVAISVFVGTRAVANAGGTGNDLVLLALALGAALYGVACGFGREESGAAGESCALHITARERGERKGFM